MMKFLPMKMFVALHVTVGMTTQAVTLGLVRLMGAGVVARPCVVEVSGVLFLYHCRSKICT